MKRPSNAIPRARTAIMLLLAASLQLLSCQHSPRPRPISSPALGPRPRPLSSPAVQSGPHPATLYPTRSDPRDRPQPPDSSPASATPPPAALTGQWKTFRSKDDLSGWIYSLIQYTAKAPAARAGLLDNGSRTAWRHPRTKEEEQAWLDLLVNTGYAYLVGGDIVHSTDSYTSAFQWARQHAEQVDPALVLDNILKPLGNNYTRLGDYEQAMYIHGKALSIATALHDKDGVAGTYANLANTAGNMNRPLQSLEYCRRGLQTLKTSSPLRGLLLSEQADAYRQLGKIPEARTSISASIDILRQGHGDASAHWLLTAYQQAGDIDAAAPQTALQYYSKALSLQQGLAQRQDNMRRRERAKLFQRLADLYLRTGDTSRTKYWTDRCLGILLPGMDPDALLPASLPAENTLADILFISARLADRQGRRDLALRRYGLSFAAEGQLRKELITGSAREWSVSVNRQRYETAIASAWDAWTTTGLPAYRQAMLDFVENGKAQLLLDELDQQSRLKNDPRDSLGNRILLLQRALIYYRKERLQYAGQEDSIARALIAKEKEIQWELAQLDKKPSAANTGSSLSAIPQKSSTLSPGPQTGSSRSAISQKDATSPGPQTGPALSAIPQKGSTLSPGPHTDPALAPIPHTGSSLPSIFHARSWFAGDRTLYTIECDSKGILFADRQSMPEGWQDSIHAFIHGWFEKGPGNMVNQPEKFYHAAYAIQRMIFGSHMLKKGGKYILLPDGALSGLPFEALVSTDRYAPSPAGWSYLCKEASISYAYSLATLQQELVTQGSQQGISGFFITDSSRGLPLLKSIHAEQQTIAALIPGGNWLVNEKGTSDAFRNALGESAIVHISSHAFSGKDSSAQPRIELYDQPFYIFELKALLHHPSLVVLNACRTGDGRLVTGDGVQSLARAFTANGANAVVAGWWNVNDQAAASLMKNFYRALITSAQSRKSASEGPGQSVPESLTQSASPDQSSAGPGQSVPESLTQSASPDQSSAGPGQSAPESLPQHSSTGPDAAECLRQSKLEWLSDPGVPYQQKLPYYWAALNYTGNPQPLTDKIFTAGNKRNISWWAWLLAALAIALAWLSWKIIHTRNPR